VVEMGTKFTDFGKIVILLLIQVGGLGIATYGAVFTSVLTGRLSLKNRAVIRDSFAHFGVTNFRTLLFEIVLFTFLVELLGALLLFIFIPEGGFFTALLHPVAAFCNTGFSFYPDSFIYIFQSATARTTGFNTIDLTLFSSSTLFIMIILMFIGASPGSCGGGIKTSTLAVLLAFIKDRSLGREVVFLSKRTIP